MRSGYCPVPRTEVGDVRDFPRAGNGILCTLPRNPHFRLGTGACFAEIGRMRIVVLDGYPMNPGDLSWEPLQALGDCVFHERTRPDETLARLAGADAGLTNKVVLDRRILRQLPALKYIGVTATGVNVVDGAAAREQGIVVTNVPAYSTRSVAQMTFALLLELTHQVGHHAEAVRRGRWSACPDFSFQDSRSGNWMD